MSQTQIIQHRPLSLFSIPSYLSSALPQGEAGKAGRPGERGAAGPQVLTHAFLIDTHKLLQIYCRHSHEVLY